jgi:hypothetical protein
MTDPQRIYVSFQAVVNNIKSFGMTTTYPDALQYERAYWSNSAVDQFKIFSTDIPDERKTIPEFKKCFKAYFLPSKSSDSLWHKWEFVKQSQVDRLQPITEVVIMLNNQRSSLPRNMISDFAMKS